jgi:biotin-(acetyl-CoA carboxylase) ligase
VGRERNRLQIAEVLDTIGRRIRWVTHGDEDGEGEATGIASDGALIVERNSPTPGRVDQLRSAEISHVRVQNDC